jgi:hypothetical protein
MDMPDEVLVQIFEHVKDWQPDEFFYTQQNPSIVGISEIMSLRLTCQRFHNASSHLLLDLVRVELNS